MPFLSHSHKHTTRFPFIKGKPFWLAKAVDIPRACYNFRFFAGAILHHVERSSMLEAMGCVNYTDRQPLGVAGLITPWNLPLYLLTWKVRLWEEKRWWFEGRGSVCE